MRARCISDCSDAQRIVRHDQPVTSEASLGEACLFKAQAAEGLDQLAIAAGRNGKDELEFPPAPIGQRGQGIDVVEAQQSAVGNHQSPPAEQGSVNKLGSPGLALRLSLREID